MPITANRDKSIVLLVESNLVEAVNVCRLCCLLLVAVAFKREVVVLAQVLLRQVVVAYPTPTFDRPDCISLSVSETGDCRGSIFQWRLGHLARIEVVLLECLIEIPNVDESILMSCHKEWKRTTHVVHWHCDVRLANLLEHGWALPRPELDSSIPASRNYHRAVVCGEHKTGNIFDRLLMLANLSDAIVGLIEVPLLYAIVGTGK